MREEDAKKQLQTELGVSRETMQVFEAYAVLLQKWNLRINLVSAPTLQSVWSRHILDSAQIWKIIQQDVNIWYDIGSGAGLPGLVISILAKQMNPSLSVTLVESDNRKCAFLRACIRELDLSARVEARRVENIENTQADVISARALADLSKLLEWSFPLMHENSVCVFLKGKSYDSELKTASESWSFTSEMFPSLTDKDASILKLQKVKSSVRN